MKAKYGTIKSLISLSPGAFRLKSVSSFVPPLHVL